MNSISLKSKIHYLLIGCFLLFLFFQNFILGFDPGLIQIRELDDLAFQLSVKKEQNYFLAHDWLQFFSFTDYGYGFIYWGPLAVVLLPFTYLSNEMGIHFPLLVFPRQLSLFFLIGSLWFLRKSIFKLGGTEGQASIALLLASLLPTFGYFSGRFGTVAELAFWGTLSFYGALSFSQNKKKIPTLALIALAAGVGVKLSGAIFMPLVLLVCCWKFRKDISIHLFSSVFISLLIFIFSLALFTNPAILASWLSSEIAEKYFVQMSHFIGVPLNGLTPEMSFSGFVVSLFGTILSFVLFSVYIAGYVIGLQTKNQFRRYVFILLLLFFVVVSAFLFFKVSSNGSAVVYFMPLTILLPLSILGFVEIQKFNLLQILASCLVVISIIDIAIRIPLQKETDDIAQDGFSPLSYLIAFQTSQKDLQTAKSISSYLHLENVKGNESIVLDYATPIDGNLLKYPDFCFGYVYSNIASFRDLCSENPKYILLDKGTIGFSSTDKFNKFRARITNPQTLEELNADREFRINLQNPEFASSLGYKLVETIGEIQIFELVR